jgi:CDP-glucose 4,6-dehydratase
MKYLITGHTGFKGTWLSLLLKNRGHQVFGIALDPIQKSLFTNIEAEGLFECDARFNIENTKQFLSLVRDISPDFIIHLAAQSLVKEGYRSPFNTYATNVLGTASVLTAIREVPLKGSLIITTDKVYKPSNLLKAFNEMDEIGGEDPYSSSKSIADKLTQNWISTYPYLKIGIARAGNVIGGGDVASDRLVPYVIRAISEEKPPVLRYPKAIRPWQHVLDCLNGYLIFLEKISENCETRVLNFGPYESDYKSVEELTELILTLYNSKLNWENDLIEHQKESHFLALDSTKAYEILKWKSKWSFEESVNRTYSWYASLKNGKSPLEACLEDIHLFEKS